LQLIFYVIWHDCFDFITIVNDKNDSVMQTLRPLKSNNISNRVILAIFSLVITVATFAQETKQVDVNISTDKGGGFMGSPWVWVIGIAIFILLLVALLRGGSRRDA
jgi:hypothetical protein